MLAMLQHTYSTQKNEVKNHYVATFAPKTKNFSKSISFTRVMLAAGAQIIGRYDLWNRIFGKLNIDINRNLA